MGIGLACFIDKAGTGPSANLAKRGGLHGGWESAIVRVHSDGKVTVFAGSHSHGQGHDITFAQIAADRLGIDIDDIRVVEGDTDRIPFGNGTWGARSTSVAGTAILRASDQHHRQGAPLRRRSAGMRKRRCRATSMAVSGCAAPTAPSALRRLPISPITAPNSRRDGSLEPGLEVTEFYDPPDTNDPQAMHLAVVIVDAETGAVTLRELYGADDCGMIVNPMIVEGQVHGGMAQGIGQALMERHRLRSRRPASDRQLHGLRHAARRATCRHFVTGFIETPAPSNPLGVKGGSESGTIGAPAAIGNAVIDALWHLGVRDIALPITPETVWRALGASAQQPQQGDKGEQLQRVRQKCNDSRQRIADRAGVVRRQDSSPACPTIG